LHTGAACCIMGIAAHTIPNKEVEAVSLHQLNLVLVEPEIPQNTGNIARTCALTGARLHLVGPLGFKLDDRYLKRAGLDYWHLLDISCYQNITEFFAKNDGPFFYFSTKARHVHSAVTYPESCYLVFGKESAGLPEELLKACPGSCVRIPMIDNPDARSLNLSNSAAIAAYEVLRQWDYPDMLLKGELHRLHW
jgi:tRNA (cytidine/uridine-2'-O-)-methyltransferase